MVLVTTKKEKPLSYACMIQEALLSEGRSSSQRFISEYILSNYPCLIHDDDHTTLLSQTLQELTQRKILSVVINVEDQSELHYTLEEAVYYENTGAERPTTALHLRPANYPRVVAQHPQGGKEGEKRIGMKKRTRKPIYCSRRKHKGSKYRSVREIGRRVDEEEKVVQNVMKNVLEARVAVVAKAVVAQLACGIERQIILEEVKERIKGMVVEVSESIVEIAAAAAAAPPPPPPVAAAAAAAATAATAYHDEVASENIEGHQNDDD